MKIIVAPDSFKESLDSIQVCRHITRAIQKVIPKAIIVQVPMADGGDGTLAILTQRNGRRLQSKVQDPLGRNIRAHYGIIDGGKTAIIEMAQASGLHLVPQHKRNPMLASSYGTGQLIREALKRRCKQVLVTLGGVATNDAGAGMASALGYQFLDKKGQPIPPGVQGFKLLHKIDKRTVDPLLKKVRFSAACDVKNPLCGPNGSAAVYGPQKGATPQMVKEIDLLLRHFSKIVKRDLNVNILNVPGAGAAGGAGAGAIAFLKAKLKNGIDLVMESTQLEKKIQGSSMIITGEGRIDLQTRFGKTLHGIALLGKKYSIPVYAFCGQAGNGSALAQSLGIKAIFPIVEGSVTVKESLKNPGLLLEKRVNQVMRKIQATIK